MKKTILITGATDGIGLETAKILAEKGYNLILHGRSSTKVETIVDTCRKIDQNLSIEGLVADFSDLKQVKYMVKNLVDQGKKIDVLINNAGVFVADNTRTVDGLELRFAVNTYAPYILSKGVLPLMEADGRIVNLSSAAQGRVDFNALKEAGRMTHNEAYAQSKLAITMWSFQMAKELKEKNGGPVVIAVNPKSFLGSKMVKEGYGMEGHDVRIGADILVRLAIDHKHGNATGKYYDNDQGRYADPHPDALDEKLRCKLIQVMDETIVKVG